MSALIGSIVAFVLGGLAILGLVPHQQMQPVPQMPQDNNAPIVQQQSIPQATNSLVSNKPVSNTIKSSATIDASSLIAYDVTPTITGTVKNTTAIVVVIFDSNGNIIYTSGDGMSVVNGKWSLVAYNEYGGALGGPGRYTIKVYDVHSNLLTSGTLTISAQTTPTRTSTISVPGMSTYTDADFGFSFWYPSGWKISAGTASNPHIFGGGTITKVLNISTSVPFLSFSIDEFDSPNRRLEYSGGACGYCGPVTWYFDTNQHLWMRQYPEGAGGMGAAYDGTRPAEPMDISDNTMGGLHIFPSEQKENVSIVPLSAHHFLIVNHNEGYENPGSHKELPLVNTILATDQSVATPVSAAEQQATIQAEKDAYAGQ